VYTAVEASPGMGRHHASTPRTGRRIAALVGAVLITGLGTAGIAAADPDFGPGNSQKGPQDAGALCHPPGQTTNFPACK
jgi:hypothetical protein